MSTVMASAKSAVNGTVADASRRDSNCTIYVGNLPPAIPEDQIKELFKNSGDIKHCKVLYPSKVDPYCFVEFFDHHTAEQAIKQMNGKMAFGKQLRVNWALSGPGGHNSSDDFPVFVGDLSEEVDESTLQKAFMQYGNIIFVRIMRDIQSGKSRGFGFVTFAKKKDAEEAILRTNGKALNGKPIKANWAIKKSRAHSIEEIAAQSSSHNSTVYIGNLTSSISDKVLRKHCEQYGSVLALRIFPEKGYAFVKYESHDIAAGAISVMNGQTLQGQIVKCSWGKENFDVPIRQQVQPSLQQQQYSMYGSSLPAPLFPYPMYYSTSALNFPVLNLDGQTSGGPIAVSMSPNGQTPFYHFGGGYGVPQSPTFTGQFQGGSGGNHFVQVAVTAPSVFPMQYQLQQGQP